MVGVEGEARDWCSDERSRYLGNERDCIDYCVKGATGACVLGMKERTVTMR